jgi:hypothetical protein
VVVVVSVTVVSVVRRTVRQDELARVHVVHWARERLGPRHVVVQVLDADGVFGTLIASSIELSADSAPIPISSAIQ